jgi:hypothetical protein
MTPGVVTVTEDTPAREIAQLMHAKQIRRVPVVRDGKLVGIVTRTDLVRALAQRLEEMSAERTGEHGASVNEALRRLVDAAQQPQLPTPGSFPDDDEMPSELPAEGSCRAASVNSLLPVDAGPAT